MQLRADAVTTIYLLAPLPLAAGIFLISRTFDILLRGSILLNGLSVATFCLLFAAGITSKAPEPVMKGGGSLAALGIAGSLGLYLWGSVAGSGFAHWAALLVLYDSMVLYLGGVGPLWIVFPPSLALLVLGFPDVAALDILTIVALTAANVYSVVTLLTKQSHVSTAEFESDHSVDGSGAHCLYCGIKVSEVLAMISGRRIAKMVVLSTVLLVASAVPFQIVSSQGGTPYGSTYRISGLVSNAPLAYSHGWSITGIQSTVQRDLGFSRLVLRHSGETVVVIMASSPSDIVASHAASNAYPEAVRTQTVHFGGSISAQLFTEDTNSSFTGLGWVSAVNSFNGTAFEPVTISYLAVESISSSSINGSGLYSLTASSLGRLEAAQQWDLFASNGFSAWQAFGGYLAIAGAVFLVGLPFETARRHDMQSVRSFENLLGLSEKEQTVLALMSTTRTLKTGRELMKEVGERIPFTEKQSFVALLVRLEGLGLISKVIKKGPGGSILLWRSK